MKTPKTLWFKNTLIFTYKPDFHWWWILDYKMLSNLMINKKMVIIVVCLSVHRWKNYKEWKFFRSMDMQRIRVIHDILENVKLGVCFYCGRKEQTILVDSECGTCGRICCNHCVEDGGTAISMFQRCQICTFFGIKLRWTNFIQK